MEALLAGLIAGLVSLRGQVVAFVLAALLGLSLRSVFLLALDRGRGAAVLLLRLMSSLAFGTLGVLYFLFAAGSVAWSARGVGLGLATLATLLGSAWLRRPGPGSARLPSPLAALALLALLLALSLLAALTLMQAGFLALTEDRPVLMVDVTGETRMQMVRWAPPDAPAREEALVAHRVVFRTPEPEDAAVAEAWLYGDEVAVKGRVLRLSPLLSAAGVPNLFELQFAHNGYRTAERHASYPHAAVGLPAIGPLAVHPWWRGLQARLLQAWQEGAAEGSGWGVRSVTTESTYYPLVDAAGRPLRQTFRLVLTPGGLSSS